MKTNRQKQRKENRMKNILIQVHSFILNLVVCLGLYSAHIPLSYAADSSSNLDQLTQNVGKSGASQSDLTTSSSAPSAAGAATSTSVAAQKKGTKVTGKNVKPSANMLLSNIALFASTMAAPILISQCPNAASVWIYGASAALYLANEIGLFTGFKNASNAEMAAYLGRGDEDKQIVSLETAAKQTQDAQKAAKKRATIAKITAAGFTAATVMALVESTKFYTGTGCEGGTSGNDFDKKLRNKEQILQESPSMIAQDESFFLKLQPKYLNIESDNFDFMITYQEHRDNLKGKLHSISIDEYRKRKSLYGKDLNRIKGLKSAFLFLTKFTAEVLSSKAAAADASNKTSNDKGNKKSGSINWSGSGVKAITGMLGAAAGVILVQKLSVEQARLVKLPYTRAALFGGMALFATGGAKEASDAAKKLSERSSEYQKLANSLRSQVNQSASNNNSPNAQTISPTSSGLSEGSNSSDGTNFCITGKATTSISVDKKCDCANSDSCKGTNLPDISKMPTFAGQSLLSDTLKSLKSAGDNVYAGNLKGATTAASSLSKKAARITRLRDALVKKINADSVAAGGKGNLDMNALQSKINNHMLKKLNAGFNKLSPAQQASLARFAPALGNSGSSKTKTAANKKNKGSAAVGGTGKIAAGSATSKSNKGTGFNFDFDEENEDTKTDPEAEALAQAMAQEDDNYVIEGDINNDRNKNIFKIITGRYLKSAYPVIFKEE